MTSTVSPSSLFLSTSSPLFSAFSSSVATISSSSSSPSSTFIAVTASAASSTSTSVIATNALLMPTAVWNSYVMQDNVKMNNTSVTTTDIPNIGFDGNNIGDIVLSNATHNDIIHNRAVQTVFCVLYVVIFVLGVFGNVLVCYVVFRNKAMQTVTNLFITNLALSDILLCILAVPFTPLYTFLRGWVFGTTLCHMVPYAQGCSVYISTLTLTSIAIDRFFVIIYPFHPRMRLTTCILIIFSIWAFSLLVTLPYGLYMIVQRWNTTDTSRFYCEENWPDESYRKLFGSITSTLQFILPFFIISFCYICVSMRLNDRAKTKPGAKSTKKEEIERDRKKRTNRMLIAMVSVFGISWLPLNSVNMVNDFYINTDEWKYYNFLFFVAHSIAMSSTCYNPFLYAWLNDNFRKEFKQVLPCFNPKQRGKVLVSSQRWQPEPTYNGNNETVQESLLTSSFTRSQCTSFGHRESIQLNGIRQSGSTFLEQSVLMSDIGLIKAEGSSDCTEHILIKKSRTPETVLLPTGVLETNFEESSELPQTVSRIRFEDDLPSKINVIS